MKYLPVMTGRSLYLVLCLVGYIKRQAREDLLTVMFRSQGSRAKVF